MATKKEEYVLPSLNARMLVDLMNDFYHQQWLAERRAEKKRKRKEREDTT